MTALAYTKLTKQTRVHVPTRYLPIVVVPGIMGTRLKDPKNQAAVWNPMGFPFSLAGGDNACPGNFAVNFARLQQITADLVPDDTPYIEDPKNAQVKGITNFFHLLTSHYGDLTKKLAGVTTVADDGAPTINAIHDIYAQSVTAYASTLDSLDPSTQPSDSDLDDANWLEKVSGYPVKPKVYCCGYDWRQDNAKSAIRLAEVVDQALTETGENKVVIVAHSMGGLVSRYYCHVLGGESKVLALFMLGTPNLGAPEAYTNLKEGGKGPFPQEIVAGAQSGGVGGALGALAPNILGTAAGIGAGIGDLVGGKGFGAAAGDVMKGMLDPLYVIACLGAGTPIARKDWVYFQRQVPSVYQLMPNDIYGAAFPNWAIFDPLNTGAPPLGFLLIMPTILDPTTTGSLATPGLGPGSSGGLQDFNGVMQHITDFMNPKPANSDFSQGVADADLIGANSETLAAAICGNLAAPTAAGKLPPNPLTAGLQQVQKIWTRLQTTFMDAFSSKQLYSDIYTGFNDVPELRSVSTMNLALCYRFHDALTTKTNDGDVINGVKQVQNLIGQIPVVGPAINVALNTFAPDAAGIEGTKNSTPGATSNPVDPTASLLGGAAIAVAGAAYSAVAPHKAPTPPKPRKPGTIYMHPNTFIAYGTEGSVDGGSLLFCTGVKSNYDSNVITWTRYPNPVALLGGMIINTFIHLPTPGQGSFGSFTTGDGTVPAGSARPDDHILPTPLAETPVTEASASTPDALDNRARAFPKIGHTDLPGDPKVIHWIKAKIAKRVMEDFFRS